MKICFLCDEYPPAQHGGIGSLVQAMARRLTEGGNSVWVVGAYSVQRVTEIEDDLGVRVIRVAIPTKRSRWRFLADRWEFGRMVRSLVENEGIDIIEAPDTGAWSLFVGRKCPVVLRFHSSRIIFPRTIRKRRGLMLTVAERLSLRRAHVLVAVSRGIADAARVGYPGSGIRKRHIEVIHNGVDTTRFEELPYENRIPNRVVFAGSLKPEKDIISLLLAFKKILRILPEVLLVMAGKDTLIDGRSYWETVLRTARISEGELNRIQTLGHVATEDMPRLYESAAVCVFPSLAESFGLVAAEAMACGRPVIYTDTPVGRELIRNLEDGLLVPAERPDELAQAILYCMREPQEAARIGRNAAARVAEDFSLDQCVEKTLRLYGTAMARGG